MTTDNKLMLNVASGVYVMEDYVNIDNSAFLALAPFYPIVKYFLKKSHRERVKQFVEAKKKAFIIRADCRKRLPFADASVDHIFCSHFLEHLYQDAAMDLLKEFYRLLKKNGTLYIIVPDIAALVDKYIKREDGDSSADKFIQSTILTWPQRPKSVFRFFNALGTFGLTHLWMYDRQSLTQKLVSVGFTIVPKEQVPNPTLEREGLHIAAIKL